MSRREIGSGRDDQLERTRRQVARIDAERREGVAVVVTNDLAVEDLARQILAIWPAAT